jgi:hypothetical protein
MAVVGDEKSKVTNILPALFTVFKPVTSTAVRKLKNRGECGNKFRTVLSSVTACYGDDCVNSTSNRKEWS